jgi:two-component system, NtrC family, response regulator AtoC
MCCCWTNLPGTSGLQALQRVRELSPSTQVIMITGHANVELAVEAMKAGAVDFLTKPVPLAKLGLLVERLASGARKDKALAYYQQREGHGADLDALIGQSPHMMRLRGTVQQLLHAEERLRDDAAPAVLVQGETGTGKELVARALHFNGPRRSHPFVELNCAALPEQLLESELFGHERGAFTDARERKLGLVETAEGGTLFLDEIGDMAPGLQAKLLKLLEERRMRRVGGVREQRVNVRVVAASHRDLAALVDAGQFRADLYFRLRVVQLDVPPLRDRGEDILLLARHFVAGHAARYGRPLPRLSQAAEALLMRHSWPGNVRELRNALEQAVLLGDGPVIDAEALALRSAAPTRAAPHAPLAGSQTLPDWEREMLQQALQRAQGSAAIRCATGSRSMACRCQRLPLCLPGRVERVVAAAGGRVQRLVAGEHRLHQILVVSPTGIEIGQHVQGHRAQRQVHRHGVQRFHRVVSPEGVGGHQVAGHADDDHRAQQEQHHHRPGRVVTDVAGLARAQHQPEVAPQHPGPRHEAVEARMPATDPSPDHPSACHCQCQVASPFVQPADVLGEPPGGQEASHQAPVAQAHGAVPDTDRGRVNAGGCRARVGLDVKA